MTPINYALWFSCKEIPGSFPTPGLAHSLSHQQAFYIELGGPAGPFALALGREEQAILALRAEIVVRASRTSQ